MELTQGYDVLFTTVHDAARDGLAITLYANLLDKATTDVENILSKTLNENGQVTTPFLIAARNGHTKVVRLLLDRFKVDIEQTGTVKFDGYVIEGATALWCAAGAGHLDVVSCLLGASANVNHATNSNSTPLRAACFDGRLDIVQYLMENKADLHIPNKYNNTCLMIASYKGHRDVVQYLLKNYANPDAKAQVGATALHFAAERGFLGIVKDLVNSNASLVANDQGMTALHISAEGSKTDIVEFFISRAECSKKDRVEALELLGASFANDKDNYDIDRAYSYMWLAMKERLLEPILPKEISLKIAAYGDRCECGSITELENIENDSDTIHMEALIMRERILGEDNIEIPHPIIFRGAVFADTAMFDQCISLWMRALELRHKNLRTISKDLLRFAQVFSQMLHIGVVLNPTVLICVLTYAVEEFIRDQNTLKKLTGEDWGTLFDIYEGNILTAVYLVTIVTKLKLTKQQEFQVCKVVHSFNKLNLSIHKSGFTPLHIVLDEKTYVDDFHVSDVVKYPCEKTAKTLIKCGANVNCVTHNGDTPLHVIVRFSRPIYDFLTLHNIIVLLIEAGAHIDMRNQERKSAMQECSGPVTEMILRCQSKISLKCICAHYVKENNISYRGQVPVTLEEFISIH